jgi:hypothetical protein
VGAALAAFVAMILLFFGAVVVRALRRRGFGAWALPWLAQTWKKRAPRRGEPVHLLLCIADHFEPQHGPVSREVAARRVGRWLEEYPRLFGSFRDSDGRPPRHTFFYPVEMYDPGEVAALAALCEAGYGEVEVHLHHDRDTAESLREQLERGKCLLADRHGQLAVDPNTGELAYGFIHGNWALNNCHPGGRHCGVENELAVLRQTGCYADFTMPSAPDATQIRKINSIYHLPTDAAGPGSLEGGVDAGTAPVPPRSLLLVQGPLGPDWTRPKWGFIPRIENGCLQGSQPPRPERIDQWLRARVQVPTRPDWFFVKLYTHGGVEWNQEVLLGESMVNLHRALAERAAADPNFHFHYVTAREMYNLVCAAEDGWQGRVDDARDYHLIPLSAYRDSATSPSSQGGGAGRAPHLVPTQPVEV